MEQQALAIALIGVLGIGAQWVAWRTGWPGIALLLLAGVIAGPVTGLIDPEHVFGPLLEPALSIAVAVILFVGGLSLDFRELRKTERGDAACRVGRTHSLAHRCAGLLLCGGACLAGDRKG